MIVKNFCCCNYDKKIGGELCVNCPLSFRVVIMFFVLFGLVGCFFFFCGVCY